MVTQFGKKEKPKKDDKGDSVIYEYIPLKKAQRIKDVITFSVKFDAQVPEFQIKKSELDRFNQ